MGKDLCFAIAFFCAAVAGVFFASTKAWAMMLLAAAVTFIALGLAIPIVIK